MIFLFFPFHLSLPFSFCSHVLFFVHPKIELKATVSQNINFPSALIFQTCLQILSISVLHYKNGNKALITNTTNKRTEKQTICMYYLHKFKYFFLCAFRLQKESIWIRTLENAASFQKLLYCIFDECGIRTASLSCKTIQHCENIFLLMSAFILV